MTPNEIKHDLQHILMTLYWNKQVWIMDDGFLRRQQVQSSPLLPYTQHFKSRTIFHLILCVNTVGVGRWCIFTETLFYPGGQQQKQRKEERSSM